MAEVLNTDLLYALASGRMPMWWAHREGALGGCQVFLSAFSGSVHRGHADPPHRGPAGGGVAELRPRCGHVDGGVAPRSGIRPLVLGTSVAGQELDDPAR